MRNNVRTSYETMSQPAGQTVHHRTLPRFTPTFPTPFPLGGTEAPTPAKKWIGALRPYATHPGVLWVTWLPLRARRRQVWLQWLWGNICKQGSPPPPGEDKVEL